MERKIKLFRLLATFSSDELNEFGRFLKAKYQPSKKKVFEVFDYLKKNNRQFLDDKLKKSTIHKKLFPKKTVSEAKINSLMHDVYNEAEDFLVRQYIEQYPSLKNKLLADALAERNLFEEYNRKYTEVYNTTKNQKQVDAQYFLNLYLLDIEKYQHPDMHTETSSEKDMNQMMMLLDQFYTISKLKWGCELINRTKIFPENYSIEMLEAVLKLAKEQLNPTHPLIKSYADLTVLLYKNGGDDVFEMLFKQLKAIYTQITTLEARNLLQFLINYANRQQHHQEKYTDYMFELYQFGLKNHLIIKNNRMTNKTYVNYVSIACFKKKYDLVKPFIEKHKNYLKEKIRNDAYYFSLAYLAFAQEEYSKVFKYIKQIEERNLSFKIRAKGLEIRMMYKQFIIDTKDYEEVLNKIFAFEKWLREHSKDIHERKINGYKNFCSFCKKLLRKKNAPLTKKEQKAMEQKLFEELAATQPIVLAHWLKKKIPIWK